MPRRPYPKPFRPLTDLGLILLRIAMFTEVISFIAHPENKALDPRIMPWVLWIGCPGAVCAIIGGVLDWKTRRVARVADLEKRLPPAEE